MIDAQLCKEKGFADKKKILAVLNSATNGMIFSEIAARLPISNSRVKGLLIVLRKSNDVFYSNGVWFSYKNSTSIHRQEPLYPDFDKEHEEWQKQILTKKQRFNPFGK